VRGRSHGEAVSEMSPRREHPRSVNRSQGTGHVGEIGERESATLARAKGRSAMRPESEITVPLIFT